MNPLQWIYTLGRSLDKFLSSSKKLKVPVLSVGNISVGGRSKTPLVIDICKQLKAKGYYPIVLTRGYGRLYSKSFWMLVENLGDLSSLSVDLVGDEALEIFLKAQVPVLVGANRYENAVSYLNMRNASKNFHQPIVFVLDDGFQHWKLKRDFDLVVVADADFSDSLLPTGRLRELPVALKRASYVLHLGKDLQKDIVVKNVESVSSLSSVAVSTRAGSQKSYAQQLSSYLNFNIEVLSFKDHLDRRLLEKELLKLPESVKQLLLGYKEAVKLVPLQSLLSSQSPLKVSISNREFEVFLVELNLNYNKNELGLKIEEAIKS